MRYEVVFSGALTAREVHERIRSGLMLPDWYGMNMDALWDVLTELPMPCQLCLTGWETLPDALTPMRQVMEEIFLRAQDWHARHGGLLTIELREAV